MFRHHERHPVHQNLPPEVHEANLSKSALVLSNIQLKETKQPCPLPSHPLAWLQ